MFSVIRRTVAAAALVGASAMTAEAQLAFGPVKIEEIRIDILNIVSVSDAFNAFAIGAPNTSTGVGATLMPSNIALGIYLNDKIAIEPSFSFLSVTPDGGDNNTMLALGVAVPYYFAGDRGKTGLFVAPMISTSKITDQDGVTDFGVDLGYKKSMNPNVSWSAALIYRTGDTYDPESVIGARFGLSIFLRQP